MSAIEVKRIGDESTKKFSVSAIGSGSVLNWVTENDASADGLVRFLNQVQEEGNALSSSLDRYPKIVKNGSLVTDGNGNPTVDWDQKNDGYEIEFSDFNNINSQQTQELELKVNPNTFAGVPQTIVNSDGLRLWEKNGEIRATISNPETQWTNIQGFPSGVFGIQSFNGLLYIFEEENRTVFQHDPEEGSFFDTAGKLTFESDNFTGDPAIFSMIEYDNKLLASEFTNALASFTGEKWLLHTYIRDDGLKIYTTDSWFTNLEEYTLTTPYDFSTAEKTNVFAVSENYNLDGGLFLKPDGQKLYFGDLSSNQIFEYNFGTSWDLSTLQFNQSIDLSNQFSSDTFLDDIFMKDDGSILYVLESSSQGTQNVQQYNLSNPYDLSSYSFDDQKDISNLDDDGNGMTFKPDGSKFYIIGGSFNKPLYAFDVSSNWDVTTASYNGEVRNMSETFAPEQDISFKNDGEEFYVVGYSGEIYEYKTRDNWDISASYLDEKNVLEEGRSGWKEELKINNSYGIEFKDDGMKAYMTATDRAGEIKEFVLSNPYDITSMTRNETIQIEEVEEKPAGIYIRDDGKKLYVSGISDETVIEFDLLTAWELKTAVINNKIDLFNTSVENLTGLSFKPDGTKMFITDGINDDIAAYDLNTPWDISSYSLSQTESLPSTNSPVGLYFKDDGTKFYTIEEFSNDKVTSYELSSNWDISTLSTLNENSNLDPRDRGLTIEENGNTLFVSGHNELTEYELDNSYNISSFTEKNNRYTGLQTFQKKSCIPYKDNLYIAHTHEVGDPGETSGGVLKYDGSTADINFLTPDDWKSIIGEPENTQRETLMWGGGVWRDELMISLFSTTPSTGSLSNTGEIILQYNPQDGWSEFFTFGSPSGTEKAERLYGTQPYQDSVYSAADSFVDNIPDNFTTWKYTDDGNTFEKAWEVDRLGYQSPMITFNEDLYVGLWQSPSDGSLESLYRFDGSNLQKESGVTSSPPAGLGVHKGELYVGTGDVFGGSSFKKGNGEELAIDYDSTKNQISIKTAVTENGLLLDVDGTQKTLNHNVNYKKTGKLRTGLSYGLKDTDQNAGVDEVFRGSIKELVRYETLTQTTFDQLVTSVSAPNIVFKTDTSIEGTVSFFDPNLVDNYEVLASPDDTQGSYNVIETFSNPTQSQVTWTHTGLTPSEDYFYKFRINRPGSSLTSSATSAIAEYSQPDPPTITITNTGTTEVSGTINSNQADRFWNKLELYRTTTQGGPYNLVTSFTGVNTEQTWTDTGLSGGTQYIYVGKAVNTTGPVDSNFSSEVSTATSIEVSGGDTESDLAIGLDSVTTKGDGDLVIGTDSETESTGGDLDVGTN